MDDWEKLNETSLPEKEDFYCHLNMEDITNTDYAHAKRVCKDFELNNLGEYHDFAWFIIVNWWIWEVWKYVSWNIRTWSCKFLSALGLAWPAALKKTKVKLDLLTDVNVLLMVEKSARVEKCCPIYRYAKAIKKCMKDYD